MNVCVVIVNFNSTDYLVNCLASVYEQTADPRLEVVVVDNASADREGVTSLQPRFPTMKLLLNPVNVGFAAACNRGIRSTTADYYLLLNPDCLIEDRAVERTVQFLDSDPEIGVVGCRVNNPDGSLQRACRRSIPRPSIAFYRFSGLSRLFPASPRFAAYNYSFLPPGESHPVEAVSGSFLLFRKEVLGTSGYLDESFFMYGEDLDFCLRARQAGWRIYYFAGAHITHIKRGSSSQRPRESTYHFYNAMRIFYRKHFLSEANAIERALVLGGIHCLYQAQRIRQALMGTAEVGSSD